MRKAFPIILLLILFSPCQAQKKVPGYVFYPVMRIVDGDTFVIRDGSAKGTTIRLIGVDAPESRSTGNKIKSEFGAEATRYLSSMISGRKVRLEYDAGRKDRYGRTLAYVFLGDGRFVNAELVKNGYANIMTVPPNVKYQELFLRLERRARSRGRGLWKKE